MPDPSEDRVLCPEAEAATRLLADHPVAALITDSSGRILWVHPEYSRLTGFSPEYLLHHTCHPGQPGHTASPIGDSGFLLVTARPVTSPPPDGDIYREMFEGAFEGIACTTPDGKIVAANPAIAGILGYDLPEETLTQISFTSHQVWADPAERDRYLQNAPQFRSTGFTTRFRRRDGSEVWVRLRGRKVIGPDGQLRYFQTFIEDISETRKIDEARRASEERFTKAFISSPTPKSIADLRDDSRLVDVNRAWERMTGFTRDEAIGKTRAELGMIGDDVQKQLGELARTVGSEGIQRQFRRKDGSKGTALVYSELLDIDGRPHIISSTIDMTGRIAAEAEIRKSEAHKRLILEATADGIWDWHIPTGKEWRSPRCAALLGYPPDQFPWSLSTLAEITHPDDHPALARFQNQLREGSDALSAEFRLRRQSGEWLWVLARGRVVERDATGSPVRVIGAYTDIHERRTAEERLRVSEELYRSLVEQASDGILICAPDQTLLAVNPALSQMLGYQPEELLRLRLSDVLDAAAENNAGHPAGKTFLAECFMLHRGGAPIAVEISSSLLPDGRQLALVRDITRRKQSERDLQQTNLRLELAAKAGELGIWELDIASGKMIAANARLYEMYGADPDHLEPTRAGWRARIHPDDLAFVIEGTNRTVREGFYKDLEFRVVHPNGAIRHIRTNCISFGGEGQPLRVIGMARDVTAEKQAAAEHERLARELTQAQKMESIGRLAGGVAHDFNNLLTVINGYSQFLLARLRPDDPSRAQLTEIAKAGDRAASLTRQLLAFGRKQAITPLLLDLNSIVADNDALLSRLIGEDIDIILALSPEPCPVFADPVQLHQVLLNLAVNARDAMPSGGQLQLTTEIITAGDGANWVRLTVSDTGAGIPDDVRQHLFEPFFTTKEQGKGTGLGLSTVYGIVQQSGGWIDVASELGVGSTFRITFPVAPGTVTTAESAPLLLRSEGSETILVVEDQQEVRQFAVDALRSLGYNVIQVANAMTALTLARNSETPVDLILTDVVMPEISGTELARRIREIRPRIAVLFMSGYLGQLLDNPAATGSKPDYLHKPFTIDELSTRVREALDNACGTTVSGFVPAA